MDAIKNRKISCRPRHLTTVAVMVILLCFLSTQAWSTGHQSQNTVPGTDVSDDMTQGIYFYRLEPSFYTGFAPRSQDPRRVTAHVGRGNQLRVTVVLSDAIIDGYLEDLATRYRVYRKLIDTNRITLTQNTAFEIFEETVLETDILNLAARRESMSTAQYRALNLKMLEMLNPDKIFHITIDFKERIKTWSRLLDDVEIKKLSREKSLDLINHILPTRLKVSNYPQSLKKSLKAVLAAYATYRQDSTPEAWEGFYGLTVALFETVSEGIYTFSGQNLDYYEFTGIYPVGTLNDYATYDGVKIPLYCCPGKRVLHIHQRTRVVDHVPEWSAYSYLPWIPYMHVGDRLHNSFHTLWFNIDLKKKGFVPETWKTNTTGSRTGDPYTKLWLLSRGPMSHGCTHVNGGHQSEFRQMMPSREADLPKVITYLSKSDHFDVFDIDGDGNPEVMGVKYFWAYSLKNKKPHKLRVANGRKPFYTWLYKKDYRYDEQDQVIFDHAKTSKFNGKRAAKGPVYENIPLYEAEYSPEKIQFYKLKTIPFARELRRVSSSYEAEGVLWK